MQGLVPLAASKADSDADAVALVESLLLADARNAQLRWECWANVDGASAFAVEAAADVLAGWANLRRLKPPTGDVGASARVIQSLEATVEREGAAMVKLILEHYVGLQPAIVETIEAELTEAFTWWESDQSQDDPSADTQALLEEADDRTQHLKLLFDRVDQLSLIGYSVEKLADVSTDLSELERAAQVVAEVETLLDEPRYDLMLRPAAEYAAGLSVGYDPLLAQRDPRLWMTTDKHQRLIRNVQRIEQAVLARMSVGVVQYAKQRAPVPLTRVGQFASAIRNVAASAEASRLALAAQMRGAHAADSESSAASPVVSPEWESAACFQFEAVDYQLITNPSTGDVYLQPPPHEKWTHLALTAGIDRDLYRVLPTEDSNHNVRRIDELAARDLKVLSEQPSLEFLEADAIDSDLAG